MTAPSAYQKVVTQYDVTEAGVDSIFYAVYDRVADISPVTLPTITGGTVALVGLNGIWIEDDWNFTAGTLSIGPTDVAGLPAGILSVVGDLCSIIILDRAITAAERAGVVAWGKARGAPGVFSLGPELVTNGDFATNDFTGWTVGNDPDASASSGAAVFGRKSAIGIDASIVNAAISGVLGQKFLVAFDVLGVTAPIFLSYRSTALSTIQDYPSLSAPGAYALTFTSTLGTHTPAFVARTNDQNITLDNISVRKLELLP